MWRAKSMLNLPVDLARGRHIKIAFGELVRLVGDDAVAATITRVSRATIARYRSLSPADAEYFPPADVVADLERVAGVCPVTELLCQMAGGTFVAEPDAPASEQSLLAAMSQLAIEFAEVTTAISAGLADARWCDRDANECVRQLNDVIRVSAQMRALARLTEGKSL